MTVENKTPVDKKNKVEKKTTLDLNLYSNLIMDLDNWLEVEAKWRAFLQHQVGPKEEAAKKLLALGDAPPDERRTAEVVLAKCREERGELEGRLERACRRIAQIKAQLAPMLLEVDRQRKIRSAAAAMR